MGKDTINNWIIPFLSVGKRGFESCFVLPLRKIMQMEVVVIEKSVFEQIQKDVQQLNNSLQMVMDTYKGIWQKEKWLDSQEVCLLWALASVLCSIIKTKSSCLSRASTARTILSVVM